ncbi:MAG TPA: single-stranded-DNA-specific exonuclease RecJ [Flavobacteriales bacterium]|nr:single-stranded-DNA-specific exonuclease RecJ [Flavobacteriales bacterium]|tara:strand:- start:207 stop:1976 length:1770 start_codon:yes stop_codon:yes gene_type:complete
MTTPLQLSNSSWIVKEQPNPDAVAQLMQNAGLTHLVASLLIQRGFEEQEDVLGFLNPALSAMHHSLLMKDMKEAVTRLHQAIEDEERILVYGDYDVDGTTAVAMVASYLEGVGGQVETYIPHRYDEGYGVSLEGVQFASENRFSLMIALDCGTKDFEPLQDAAERGIDVIVCDHHLPEENLPAAFAVLNPKRRDCPYPFKELSGCGVAFKLLQSLAYSMDLPESGIYEELDLVAISIGADLVELKGENRIMASQGMRQLRKRQRPGILALMRAADIHQAPQTIRDISFTLGPRINAAGRMDHAQRVVDLLMEKSDVRASEMAREIEEMNHQRREVDEVTTAEALMKLEKTPEEPFCNIVYGTDWHRGVVGIVASRIIEHRYRPSVVLSEENGVLIGSARSVDGVDIHQALETCEDLLIQFGGHTMAAGLSLDLKHLEAFKERLNEAVKTQLNGMPPRPIIRCDREVHISELSLEALKELEQLEPFGPGNATPVFILRNVVSVRPPRTIGNQGRHLKITICDPEFEGVAIDAIGWNMGELAPQIKQNTWIDLAFTLVKNTWKPRGWQNRTELNLHLRAIQPSASAVSDAR